jgi:hypothetical protein
MKVYNVGAHRSRERFEVTDSDAVVETFTQGDSKSILNESLFIFMHVTDQYLMRLLLSKLKP